MGLNIKDLQRFEKQIILKKVGVKGQKKFEKAKILIIGMGGLGCPLLTYLASSGICNIGIVDHDRIELSNLNRQTLFNTCDLGKFKSDCAKKAIGKINKKVNVVSYKEKLTKKI